MTNKKITVLTGAGISAESGLKTFRDANGLWEGHDVMSVASPDGWRRDPQLVLNFYNLRRKQLLKASPNQAHYLLAGLQNKFEVSIITQNVDDLHERSGSKDVLHLHGELLKVVSCKDPALIYPWKEDLKIGDRAGDGSQLRPFVVWFGEPVPMIEPAINKIRESDVLLIIGTSLQVYPAASLVQFLSDDVPVIYVDPSPTISYELKSRRNLRIIKSPASTGVEQAIELL
ncbi:MAG: NAD-dependent deacylase [Saprospiraceae bacterium]|nr:NAD-dependent deacylase [Saprospiraceae bacterium]